MRRPQAADGGGYDARIGAILALAGAGLFALLIWRLGFGYGGGWDPRAAWLLTPVFLAPLATYLVWSRRLGVGPVVLLVLMITAVHFTAIATASSIYKPQKDDSWMHILDKTQGQMDAFQAEHAAQRVVAARTALEGGRKAGAIGSFASWAGLLLFGRALRRPLALAAMLVSGAALTVWGGVALDHRWPEAMTPGDYALWVFLPWQGLFGLTLAGLLHHPKLSH